ncbi:MAG: GYDIA family GHMP kinase [Saprospiraceae bacterium]
MTSNPLPDTTIRAQGKLLLTGEYAVLDGALALALPARYGQTLEVSLGGQTGVLTWASLDETGGIWFEAAFALPGLEALHSTDQPTVYRLREMLLACRRQNPFFLADDAAMHVQTCTDFPREWGLGTSSTLIAALARWAGADPYRVLFDTLGGSGYDIACAFAEGPLLYRLDSGQPQVEPVVFDPPFADRLFFVFLGKKQDSRVGIRHFRERAQGDTGLVEAISEITRQCLNAGALGDFCAALLEHERLIGRALDLPRAQELYFGDFPGTVKSLGAWGGDFVLAASAAGDTERYFRERGFAVCIPYADMVATKKANS